MNIGVEILNADRRVRRDIGMLEADAARVSRARAQGFREVFEDPRFSVLETVRDIAPRLSVTRQRGDGPPRVVLAALTQAHARAADANSPAAALLRSMSFDVLHTRAGDCSAHLEALSLILQRSGPAFALCFGSVPAGRCRIAPDAGVVFSDVAALVSASPEAGPARLGYCRVEAMATSGDDLAARGREILRAVRTLRDDLCARQAIRASDIGAWYVDNLSRALLPILVAALQIPQQNLRQHDREKGGHSFGLESLMGALAHSAKTALPGMLDRVGVISLSRSFAGMAVLE